MDFVLSVLGVTLVHDVGNEVVGGTLGVLDLHVRLQQVTELDTADRKVDDGRVLLHEKGVFREPEESDRSFAYKTLHCNQAALTVQSVIPAITAGNVKANRRKSKSC